MSQIQVIGAQLYGTVFMNGRILGPGYYAENDGRLSRADFQSIIDYEDRQKSLAPEFRDNPPLMKLDFIPLDQKVEKPERGPVDYTKKSIGELRGICKKRGIQFDKKAGVEALAEMLAEYDREILSWTETFKSVDEYAALDDAQKLAYLEDIFGLPEGMDQDSDEAAKYSADLVSAVKCYSTLSQSNDVNAKLREIIEYYES